MLDDDSKRRDITLDIVDRIIVDCSVRDSPGIAVIRIEQDSVDRWEPGFVCRFLVEVLYNVILISILS